MYQRRNSFVHHLHAPHYDYDKVSINTMLSVSREYVEGEVSHKHNPVAMAEGTMELINDHDSSTLLPSPVPSDEVLSLSSQSTGSEYLSSTRSSTCSTRSSVSWTIKPRRSDGGASYSVDSNSFRPNTFVKCEDELGRRRVRWSDLEGKEDMLPEDPVQEAIMEARRESPKEKSSKSKSHGKHEGRRMKRATIEERDCKRVEKEIKQRREHRRERIELQQQRRRGDEIKECIRIHEIERRKIEQQIEQRRQQILEEKEAEQKMKSRQTSAAQRRHSQQLGQVGAGQQSSVEQRTETEQDRQRIDGRRHSSDRKHRRHRSKSRPIEPPATYDSQLQRKSGQKREPRSLRSSTKSHSSSSPLSSKRRSLTSYSAHESSLWSSHTDSESYADDPPDDASLGSPFDTTFEMAGVETDGDLFGPRLSDITVESTSFRDHKKSHIINVTKPISKLPKAFNRTPPSNGWCTPLGVHKIVCAHPGLPVTVDVHRCSAPIKRQVIKQPSRRHSSGDNLDGHVHTEVDLVIPPGSYVEILDTQVHDGRVRGKVAWEEEMTRIDSLEDEPEVKRRFSLSRCRAKTKPCIPLPDVKKYIGWISLQWASDDDSGCTETTASSTISSGSYSFRKDTDEDEGPWTEPVPLGVYCVSLGGLPLRKAAEQGSEVIDLLECGRYVEVIETQSIGDRVRARCITTKRNEDNSIQSNSGWINLYNAVTGSSRASPVPLGVYVSNSSSGCVITEGSRLDSNIKSILPCGSCANVVATRIEDGVVRGLVETGGFISLSVPPRTYKCGKKHREASYDHDMFAVPVLLELVCHTT